MTIGNNSGRRPLLHKIRVSMRIVKWIAREKSETKIKLILSLSHILPFCTRCSDYSGIDAMTMINENRMENVVSYEH